MPATAPTRHVRFTCPACGNQGDRPWAHLVARYGVDSLEAAAARSRCLGLRGTCGRRGRAEFVPGRPPPDPTAAVASWSRGPR